MFVGQPLQMTEDIHAGNYFGGCVVESYRTATIEGKASALAGDIIVAGRNFGCDSSGPGHMPREVGIVAIVVGPATALFASARKAGPIELRLRRDQVHCFSTYLGLMDNQNRKSQKMKEHLWA